MHLRKLASLLNNEDKINYVWKMKRADLESALEKVKYRVHEDNRRLVPTVAMKRKRIIKLPEWGIYAKK